jgi:hypothetical protein
MLAELVEEFHRKSFNSLGVKSVLFGKEIHYKDTNYFAFKISL